jgi:translation initiation factor 6
VLESIDFEGSVCIGIFASTNDRITFIQQSLPNHLRRVIRKILQTEVIELSIGGSNLIGSLLAINLSGGIIADFATEEEIELIKSTGLKVARLEDKFNAAGNNILCNDKGALVNPNLSEQSIKRIEDILGVPVKPGTLANLPTVGTAAFATNKGIVCHPKTTLQEIKTLSALLRVEVSPATINNGVPFVGVGLVGNTKGAVVGARTNGLEKGRIEEVLKYF